MYHHIGWKGEEEVHHAKYQQGSRSADCADISQKRIQEDTDTDGDDKDTVNRHVQLLEFIPQIIEAIRAVLALVGAVHLVVRDLLCAIFTFFHIITAYSNR